MSRHLIMALNSNEHMIWVGWDSPLGTYFGQVFNRNTSEGDKSIYWVGTEINEIKTTSELRRRLATYAQLSPETVVALEADREREGDKTSRTSNQTVRNIEMPQLMEMWAQNRTARDAEQTRIKELHEQLRGLGASITPSARVLLDLLDLAHLDPHPFNDVDRSAYNGRNRERVRELGQQAHALGGFGQMQRYYHNVYPADRRDLEIAWHGIGDWQR